MTISFTPYLRFPGNTRDALAFYAEVLGGSVEVTTYGEYGHAEDGMADKVMHSTLKADGIELHAADEPEGAAGGGTPRVGIALALMSPEPGNLEQVFARLAEGGEVTTPLERQAWGDTYGEVTDRFGVAWMIDFHDGTPDAG